MSDWKPLNGESMGRTSMPTPLKGCMWLSNWMSPFPREKVAPHMRSPPLLHWRKVFARPRMLLHLTAPKATCELNITWHNLPSLITPFRPRNQGLSAAGINPARRTPLSPSRALIVGLMTAAAAQHEVKLHRPDPQLGSPSLLPSRSRNGRK
jgi:hypothetical protein